MQYQPTNSGASFVYRRASILARKLTPSGMVYTVRDLLQVLVLVLVSVLAAAAADMLDSHLDKR